MGQFCRSIHCVKSVEIPRFFCSVFSRILTEYGDLFRKSPYSVRMRENTGQKKLRIWTLFTYWQFWCFELTFPHLYHQHEYFCHRLIFFWQFFSQSTSIFVSSENKNINFQVWINYQKVSGRKEIQEIQIPFHCTGPFLYPLKIPEKQKLVFSAVIKTYHWHKMG